MTLGAAGDTSRRSSSNGGVTLANIRAYVSGSSVASSGDYLNPITCDTCYIGGADSSAKAFTVRVDTSGFSRSGTYTITLIGTYASRYALSLSSGSGWTDWGATSGLAITGPITYTGTTVYLKKRGILGDPIASTSTRAQIRLPQDNIV
jgi:hypothetical protein